LVVYFWGSEQRRAAVEALRRAVARQLLIASVEQKVGDVKKQVTLLNQVTPEAAESGARPEEIKQFSDQLTAISQQIEQLGDLSDPAARSKMESFEKTFEELSGSWRVFYSNLGKNQAKAIKELAIHADPLSEEVLRQIPQLAADERRRVAQARAHLDQGAHPTTPIIP